MAQEVKENINFPRFETKRFNPDGTIIVAGTTAQTYDRFEKNINEILDVTNDKKLGRLYIPAYTHVDYRLWLLNLFKNVNEEEEERNYLGSTPSRIINNPKLDDNTKQAFKRFYNENTEKIQKVQTNLTIEKVIEERKLEADRYKDIAKKKEKTKKKRKVKRMKKMVCQKRKKMVCQKRKKKKKQKMNKEKMKNKRKYQKTLTKIQR